MTDVAFAVARADAAVATASPQIALRLVVTAADPVARIQSILLRSQVRIEAGARPHSAAERERLGDVFGADPAMFERAPKSLLWAQLTSSVTAFSGNTEVDVLLPCGFDVASAATRYLHGVESGDVPVTVHLSGTVFTETPGGLRVSQIPWDREARGKVPVTAIAAALHAHYPGVAPALLRKETFDALDAYRRHRGLVSLDDAVTELLTRAARKGDAA